uniref:RNA polymerase sigma factor n=1 Tax=Bacillus sp. FJAT-47783 TaxID=2922712 RepID=UPI001FADAD70
SENSYRDLSRQRLRYQSFRFFHIHIWKNIRFLHKQPQVMVMSQNYDIPSNLLGWLTTVSKNTATDHLRKLKRNHDLLDELQHDIYNPLSAPKFQSPEEYAIAKQTVQSVKELLDKLDEETRNILILRQQGFAYHEISDKLNIPLNTVKTKIFRGRKQLMSNLINKEVF